MKTVKLFALILVLASAFLWGCLGTDDTPTPGGNTFVSNGGNGGTGNGGAGGSINIGDSFDYGPVYGDVRVNNSGSLDTRFTVPPVLDVADSIETIGFTLNYGANKLTITGNKVVTIETSSPCAGAAGPVYQYSSSSTLYYCDSIAGETAATGLEVLPGATLTLPDNMGSEASITLSNDITINGTVKTATSGMELYIVTSGSGVLQIGPGGIVTTKSTTAGVDGGYIYLDSNGIAINKGTIDASGTAGTASVTDGSAGGGVDFEADLSLYNIGVILCRGGSSAYGAGGKGRHVHLFAYSQTLYNSGTIDVSGGNGSTSGGNGGWNIKLYGAQGFTATSAMISGSLIADGGTGGTGNGGYGGTIKLESDGGKLWSNANISSRGGSSAAAAGGNGGDFYLFGYYYGDYETMGIKLSGAINLSGGNGAVGGGDAGYIYFENDVSYDDAESYYLLPSPAVELVGFASLTLNGGTGVIGGYGGYFQIFTSPYSCYDCENTVFGGLILNQVPVYAKGGAGTTTGGAGGVVDFNMYYFLGGPSPFSSSPILTGPVTTNLAAIDVSGGSGVTGGNGGLFGMIGFGTILNSGAVNAKGGTGTMNGGHGAGWGSFIASSGKTVYSPSDAGPTPDSAVLFYSYFNIENSGAIDVGGGNGGNAGNYGAAVSMFAYGGVANTATVRTAGGTGSASGGNGGDINFESYSWPTVYDILQLNTKGGAVGGVDGCINIDGGSSCGG